ncbi:MAG: hypothetical protein Solumvirus1_68, partial [Solumvirus sp.]
MDIWALGILFCRSLLDKMPKIIYNNKSYDYVEFLVANEKKDP